MITFIIPSKGRKTLADTLCSLYEQTNPNWRAVVIFDGVKPTISNKYKNVDVIHSKTKLGVGINGAGYVRNVGLNYILARSTGMWDYTRWVGFVDDDDTLSSQYVQHVVNTPSNIDLIVFKMIYQDGSTLPPNDVKNIKDLENKVGISFCFRWKSPLTTIRFTPSSGEDFDFLTKINKELPEAAIDINPNIGYITAPLGLAEDRK